LNYDDYELINSENKEKNDENEKNESEKNKIMQNVETKNEIIMLFN